MKTIEVSHDTGISTGALSNYENDKREIGSDFLLKLKEVYNAYIYYILTGVKNDELAVKENELLKYYRQLPEQEQLRELGRLEAKAEQYQKQNSTRSRARKNYHPVGLVKKNIKGKTVSQFSARIGN